MKKPLIIACGLSGSGKTFNASHIASALDDYVHVHAEKVREELGIVSYSRKDTPAVLARMVKKIEEFNEEDKGVIIDANLKTNDTRQIFYDVAKHHGLPAVVIEFICDSESSDSRKGLGSFSTFK